MPELNLFQVFTNRLNRMGIRYMVTGAAASIIYGEPRLTHDIDLVIELKREDAGKFEKAFPPGEFYCPYEENIKVEANRSSRGHFNIIHNETGFRADCYLMGQDELHFWGMANRREFIVEQEPVWVAPPEYVIVRKLEYYREGRSEKHLRDIVSMLTISPDRINFEILREKIRIYDLEKEWLTAKKLMDSC